MIVLSWLVWGVAAFIMLATASYLSRKSPAAWIRPVFWAVPLGAMFITAVELISKYHLIWIAVAYVILFMLILVALEAAADRKSFHQPIPNCIVDEAPRQMDPRVKASLKALAEQPFQLDINKLLFDEAMTPEMFDSTEMMEIYSLRSAYRINFLSEETELGQDRSAWKALRNYFVIASYDALRQYSQSIGGGDVSSSYDPERELEFDEELDDAGGDDDSAKAVLAASLAYVTTDWPSVTRRQLKAVCTWDEAEAKKWLAAADLPK